MKPQDLKELAAKATPGKRVVRDEDPDWIVILDDKWNTSSSFSPIAELHGDESHDADLIAACSRERVEALAELWEKAQRVKSDYRIMSDIAGNESASVSAEAMVGMEAALSQLEEME